MQPPPLPGVTSAPAMVQLPPAAKRDRQPRGRPRLHRERGIAERPIRQRREGDRLAGAADGEAARDVRGRLVVGAAALRGDQRAGAGARERHEVAGEGARAGGRERHGKTGAGRGRDRERAARRTPGRPPRRSRSPAAARPIDSVCETSGAGRYVESPPCDAVIVQLPAPSSVTTPAASAQAPLAANVTGSPEDAVAVTVSGGLPKIGLARSGKVISWGVRRGVARMMWVVGLSPPTWRRNAIWPVSLTER